MFVYRYSITNLIFNTIGEGLAEETQPVEVTTVSTTYEPRSYDYTVFVYFIMLLNYNVNLVAELSPQRSSSLVAIVVTACVCTLAVFLVTASMCITMSL